MTSISFSDEQSEDSATNEDDFDYEENFLEEQESLYVNVQIPMPNQVLQIDVNLDMYPEIKADLQNIFCIKVSLIDLARKLERDLLIFEHEPKRFILGFKKDYNLSMSPTMMTPERLATKTPTTPCAQELASDRTPRVEELSKEENETIVFNSSPRQEQFNTARHMVNSEGASSMVKQSSNTSNGKIAQDTEHGSAP